MKTFRYILAVAAAVVSLGSCATLHTSTADNRSAIVFQKENLEYVGQVEVSVEYDTYLGIFSRIISINGGAYDRSHVRYSSIDNLFIKDKLSKAAYKAYDAFPEADYFVLVRKETVREPMFLSSRHNRQAVIKAYKRLR